jgi:hypothetical protein
MRERRALPEGGADVSMLRRITDDERPTTSFPLQAYAFATSPPPGSDIGRYAGMVAYTTGNTTYVVEEGGTTLAAASAIPMRQHVRGLVFPMAGIAGVTTSPVSRRRGHIRALLRELLGEMRDTGRPVSVLYPFRTSFYERFGYAGLPMTPTVRFAPAVLGPLVGARLPGEVTWERIGPGYETHRGFVLRLLTQRHGFSVFPDFRAVQWRDLNERWLVTARVGGEVVGALTYRITEHGEDLAADDLLYTDALSRALLLQFLARHVDQVTRVVMTLPPGETPELWATDFAVTVENRVSFPDSIAPMARVLSLDALAGITVGPGRASIRVVDDPYLAGEYTVDGAAGKLEVTRGTAASAPAATLTATGLSALVYGVLDPGEFGLRGFGDVSPEAVGELRGLFPRANPHIYAHF